MDLDGKTLTVRRTVVEVDGSTSSKLYPKSRAGHRTVPLPGWLVLVLKVHMEEYGEGSKGEIFTNGIGGTLLRSNFRRQVWRRSLVRDGLLGEIAKQDDGAFYATPTRRGSISSGLPVNEVARVLGYEQVTTTLNRYTQVMPDTSARNKRIRDALEDFPLTPPEE